MRGKFTFFCFHKNGSQVNLLFLDVPYPIHLKFTTQKTGYWAIH